MLTCVNLLRSTILRFQHGRSAGRLAAAAKAKPTFWYRLIQISFPSRGHSGLRLENPDVEAIAVEQRRPAIVRAPSSALAQEGIVEKTRIVVDSRKARYPIIPARFR